MLSLKNDAPHNLVLSIAQSFIPARVLILFSEMASQRLFAPKDFFSLDEMAKTLNVNPDALKRFLRLLIAYNILNEENGRYSLTTPSQELKSIGSLALSKKYQKLNLIFNSHRLHKKFTPQELTVLIHYLDEFQEAKQRGSVAVKVAYDFVMARLIIHLAELGFESHVGQRFITPHGLSEKLNFPVELFEKCIPILAQYQIIELSSDHLVRSTPLSDSLPWVLSPHIMDSYHLFDSVDHTLRSNDASWPKVYGYNFYEYLNHYPEKLTMFKNWCAVSAIGWLEAVLLWCRFPKCTCLVDIGGGAGVFLKRVLEINPVTKGILFEQPSIIQNIDPRLFSDFAERIELTAGDFFNDKTIPKNGDIYVICRTLLNWSNEDVIRILNNCRKAMSPGAKLIIIDFIIPNHNHLRYQRAVLNDISLFTILNSAIRTKEEWEHIISKTTLKIVRFKITEDNELPVQYIPYYSMCFIELSPEIDAT